MNLVLLHEHHFTAPSTALLKGRYAEHFNNVLKAQVGDSVWVGRLNGQCGQATVIELTHSEVTLSISELTTPPPKTLPLTVILALPRPRMLQRSLQTMATLGVERICLIQTQRVEKSFWQTPLLKNDAVEEQLILGIEQAKATQMPHVSLHTNFNYFIKHEAGALFEGKNSFVAHPGLYPPAEPQTEPCVVVIGPEGGLVEPELNRFIELGCQPIQLGQRILRVETAIPVLIAKLF